VVFAVQLALFPPSQRPLLVLRPPPKAEVQWTRLTVPLLFKGTRLSSDEVQQTLIDIDCGGKLQRCADMATAAPLDAEVAHISGPGFISAPLLACAGTAYPGELQFMVRLRPSLSGVAASDRYWSADANHGGYLIWFMDPAGTRVLFTLVVEPNGAYRFIDGALWGAGGMRDAAREYTISQRAGVLGMSRKRQRLRVDWEARGFRQENGGLLAQPGGAQWYSSFTFPEGQLLIDVGPVE
jgi:hypothetical protein